MKTLNKLNIEPGLNFLKKSKGSQFTQGVATIQYVDAKGNHQETTLEIDPENISFTTKR